VKNTRIGSSLDADGVCDIIGVTVIVRSDMGEDSVWLADVHDVAMATMITAVANSLNIGSPENYKDELPF